MGMFGSARGPSAAAGYVPPQQRPSALEVLGTIADNTLTGGLFHSLNQRHLRQAALQQQLADRQEIGGLFTPGSRTASAPAPIGDASGLNVFAGGEYGTAPTQTFGGDSVRVTPPHTPTLDEAIPTLARAATHGTDVSQFLAMLKAAEPNTQIYNGVAYDPRKIAPGERVGVNLQNVNNRMVDTQNPDNANLTVPQVDKGQVVAYDARSVPMGVQNLPGNAQAQAEVAGGVANAQETAKAANDLVDVPMGNGSTIKLPRLQALRLLGGGAAGPLPVGRSSAPEGLGVSQSPNDKAYGDEQAKASAARYQQVQTAGSQAPGKIAQYQELGRLFDGVNGNRLSGTGLEIARLGKSLGFNIDPNVGNKEAGVALANQIALTLRDPSNGAGMPGSMSDSDRRFLTQMVPNLAQTDPGRRQLVDIYIKKAARDQDTAKLARQWQQRYGRIDAPDANGVMFEDQLQKWSEAHPLFGKR